MMGAYAYANKLIMASCSTLLCVWVCLCVFLLYPDAKHVRRSFGIMDLYSPMAKTDGKCSSKSPRLWKSISSAQLSNTFEPSSLEMPTCLGPPKVSVVQPTSVSGRHRKQRDGRFSRSIWNYQSLDWFKGNLQETMVFTIKYRAFL